MWACTATLIWHMCIQEASSLHLNTAINLLCSAVKTTTTNNCIPAWVGRQFITLALGCIHPCTAFLLHPSASAYKLPTSLNECHSCMHGFSFQPRIASPCQVSGCLWRDIVWRDIVWRSVRSGQFT